MKCWIDGVVLESPEAPAVSVLDHGLVVGDGVFETVQVAAGRPFALTRHLDRLVRSAEGLGIGLPDLGFVRQGVDAVLDGQRYPFARLRIMVTSGPGAMGSPRGPGPLTYIAVAEETVPPAASTAVVTAAWPRNERGILAGLKTTSYAENAALVEYARARGATETIVPNTAGHLCEGTGANIFYEHEGRLVTPTLDSGCLAGVTRALVLEWCSEDLAIIEEDAPIERLQSAEEMFIVSTTRNVMAVHRIDDRELAAPGPLTKRASDAFLARMAENADP